MEDKNYLTEAFKAFEGLDTLNEDVFDISLSDGLEKAREFEDEEVVEDDVEVIVDPLAKDEEEIQDSYLGKAILKCSVCQTDMYKDPEEVTIKEESDLVNVGEPCPICQCEEGFYVVGQVGDFDKEEDKDKEDNKEETKTDDEEEIVFEEDEEEDKEPLEERNLTRAERHNRDMERIFNHARNLDNQKAQFLLDNGVSQEEVEELKKHTGLGRDALGDKLVELGLNDEFFNKYYKKEDTTRDDIDARKDNRIEKARKTLSRKLDDADSLRDERRKSARNTL